MAREEKTIKNIACLESLWNSNLESRLTVFPVLDTLAKHYRFRLSYLTCNTRPEFEYNLHLLPRRKTYKILYLSFHGDLGCICLADGSTVSLPELAEIMGTKFSDWIIHFGSCSTIEAKEELRDFAKNTGAVMVTGYSRGTDWIESAAMDMLLLSWLQESNDLSWVKKKVTQNYPDLINITSFSIFTPRRSKTKEAEE